MDSNCIDNAKIGVLGDFCIDVYWEVDMKKSELSLETPQFSHPVTAERIYAGAAGNVAVNLKKLCPALVEVCGVVGKDWRAAVLKSVLEREGISTDGFIEDSSLSTNAYCKPILHGFSDTIYEDSRLDFENFKSISPKTEQEILAWLDKIATKVNVLCVCDQFRVGIITDRIRDKITELAQNGLIVIVDSRYKAGLYKNVIIKPNEKECHLAVYNKAADNEISKEEAILTAQKLSMLTESKILLTLGKNGSAFVNKDNVIFCEAVKVDGKLDVCGCGDAYLGGFAAMLAGGAELKDAMRVGSAAAAFAIKSIGITGNATREDILKRL